MKKNTHVKTNVELKKFGITIACAVQLLFNLIFPLIKFRSFHYSLKLWPSVFCLIFLVLSFVAPQLLRIPEILWTKLGAALGFVNSRIILGVIYLCIFTPISILKKIFSNKTISQSNTYRSICTERDAKSLERIF